jgi:acetoin utilization deacetylase AcuC-like enzyme
MRGADRVDPGCGRPDRSTRRPWPVPITQVHDAGYVDFLQRAHREWLAAGREGQAIPYTFPTVHRRLRSFNRIDADLGQYSIDTSTPIGSGTWAASYWGAQCALSGVEAVLGGSTAFGLVPPRPVTHAGKDYYGGYSYLNNAVVAAAHAQGRGAARVAILDVDYHHGNGTQDMVADLEGLRFASLHADPCERLPLLLGPCRREMGPRSTIFPCRVARPSRPMTQRWPVPVTGWQRSRRSCWW